jgi:hypothetical protein
MGALFSIDATTPIPETKSLTTIQAVTGFIAAQKKKWNDGYTFSSKIRGTAGGDGDWPKEKLAFGFHVENTNWSVYRVWSRPWLVTK